MLDKKLIFSFITAIVLYAIMYHTTCEDKRSYYDQKSVIYAIVMGLLVFFAMRSMESNDTTVVGGKPIYNENVMTTPFGQ